MAPRMCRAMVFAIAMAAGLWAGAASAAAPARMTLGARAVPPLGFYQFCRQNPGDCAAPASSRPILLDPESAGFGGPLLTAAFSLRDLDANLREADDVDALAGLDATPLPALDQLAAAADLALARLARSAPTAEVAAPIEIAMTADAKALLNAVNRSVNREVRARSDLQTVRRAEYWSYPIVLNGARYGDCEDYALEKRRRLIAAGVPAAALTLAVAHTRQGLVHAVLIASTDQGDLVLDNRSDRISSWSKTRYRWVMRQAAGDSMDWAYIGAAQADATT